MVKEAYRKFFTKSLPVLWSMWILLAFMEIIFRAAGSDFLFAHPHNPPVVRLLAWAGVCTPFVLTAGGLVKIGRFRRSLQEYGDGIRGQMEEEFSRGAHFGDLYFTRACLVLHGIYHWACIPYGDIESVKMSETAQRQGQRILVIRTAGKRVYRRAMPSSRRLSELEALLDLYRSGAVAVPTVTEEQAARENAAERAAKRRELLRSPSMAIPFSFLILFVHLLVCCGLIYFPDMALNNPQLSPRVFAHLILWPNLLMILWTIFIAVIQLRLFLRTVRTVMTSDLDSSCAGKAVFGVLLCLGFSLFLVLVCILDQFPLMIRCASLLFS